MAKMAATKALRHIAPVIPCKAAKSSSAAAVCRNTLVKWWPAGFSPNSWQSSMCEMVVSGCQFRAWGWVKAARRPLEVRPAVNGGILIDVCRIVVVDKLMA